jgi:hypothetical protein
MRLEALMVTTMKMAVFWDVATYVFETSLLPPSSE